ncbi:UNVERIFIED_CONTAM: hypothetical protein K2H54_056102 [Gekko kuhli]
MQSRQLPKEAEAQAGEGAVATSSLALSPSPYACSDREKAQTNIPLSSHPEASEKAAASSPGDRLRPVRLLLFFFLSGAVSGIRTTAPSTLSTQLRNKKKTKDPDCLH